MAKYFQTEEKRKIIKELLGTKEGRRKIAEAMCEPYRKKKKEISVDKDTEKNISSSAEKKLYLDV